MMPAYSSNKPFNVAVALDHRGFEICRQRKTQPYDMKRHEQRNFGLEPILDSDSCRENIAFSHRILYLVDSPASGIRMLILICEDLTQDPGLQAIREFHPTLVLAPVMAARAAWKSKPGNPPLGLVGLPLLSVPHDHRPVEMLTDVESIPGPTSPQVLLFQFIS
jgi:predicted amidohydrolase